jgi:hypothetical protein
MAATIKCDTIQNTSSATANVTLDGSGNATVGNNLTVTGQTIPSSSFKRNRLINGNMAVDQRATATTAVTLSTLNQYTVDRWACSASGTPANLTAQRVSTGLSSFPYALRILRSSGTYTGVAAAAQVVETINCQDLAGQTVVFSFYARGGSSFANTIYMQGITGSGTDQGVNGATSGGWTTWAGPVILGATSLTTTLTRYSGTLAVPAGTNEIAIYIAVNWTSGTGSANDYVDITGVQLEVGSAATPYERQIYSDQLAQCQRYYFRQTSAASDAFGVGFNNTTTTAFGLVYYPVIMRTAPTALEQSGTATNYRVRYTGSAAATCSAVPTFGTADTNCALVVFTVASGLTAGQGMTIESNASTAYLGWSAEL